MLGAEANVRIRRQMVDLTRAGNGRVYSVKIQEIDFNQTEVRLAQCVLEKTALASRKIINANNEVSVVNKSIDQVASYEAGASGNRHCLTHSSRTTTRRLRKPAGLLIGDRPSVYPIMQPRAGLRL